MRKYYRQVDVYLLLASLRTPLFLLFRCMAVVGYGKMFPNSEQKRHPHVPAHLHLLCCPYDVETLDIFRRKQATENARLKFAMTAGISSTPSHCSLSTPVEFPVSALVPQLQGIQPPPLAFFGEVDPEASASSIVSNSASLLLFCKPPAGV